MVLTHLLCWLRSRRPAYRPEVVIFTRGWRREWQYRVDLNPCFAVRRPPAKREDKKPPQR